MSDELKLSNQLINDILQYLVQHDSRCENELIACQYLSAVIGYVVEKQRISPEQKVEITEELLAFIRHVASESAAHSQQASPPIQDPAKAFGIWKPSDA